jgi:hypothetical protein
MDILKRLRIERNALLKKAKQVRKEAAQLLKNMKVIQDIEKGIAKDRNAGKRKMSAAARRRISQAQRKRWAAKRADEKKS